MTLNLNRNITKEYAMGIMLQFVKDEYKNYTTLDRIEDELINLYHKVSDSELYSYFFYCMAKENNFQFKSKFDFSNWRANDNEENFFILLRNLILILKEDIDFEESLSYHVSDIFDFLPSYIFSFFSTCTKDIQKHSHTLGLRWKSFNTILDNVFSKLYKVENIFLKNGVESKRIDSTENILKICEDLNENEKLHLVFEKKEIVIYKVNNELHILKFVQNILHDILPFIFNTNNYFLMSHAVNLINYDILQELSEEQKTKIMNFIKINNKNNEIVLKKKMPSDVVKYVINNMINPDFKEENDIHISVGKQLLKQANKNVNSFLFNLNQKTKRDFSKIIILLLNYCEQVRNCFEDEKYREIRTKINMEIIKKIYKLFETELAALFFETKKKFLEKTMNKAKEFLTDSKNEEFNKIMNNFLQKYN
jgi:hypothetical protein